MKTRHLLLIVLLLFGSAFPVFSQNEAAKYLMGRVISMREGKPVGVADVKVEIRDVHYDITDGDGYFKLVLPPGQDFVNIELSNTAFRMISPYSGIVNLPPDEQFQILVCGEQNRQLLTQVEQLKKRVSGYEKKQALDARQLASMYRVMLDTILFYEKTIQRIEGELAKMSEANLALADSLAAKNREIDGFRVSVNSLVGQLADALEEKYLRQKKAYDEITATLNDYADKAKNLRDNLRPELISAYFLPQNEPMRQQLYKKEEEYNAAYARVVKQHVAHIEAVRHYWNKASLAQETAETYAFLLKVLHEKSVYPMDTMGVNENLRRWALGDSRPKASKSAERAVNENTPLLNSRIADFEKMKNDLIQNLKFGL